MDKIAIRVAGYEWALRSAPDGFDDQQVMEAYEKSFSGASFTDEGFAAFEAGVMDAHFEDMPVLSITDIARLANVSDRYVRQEVADGRLIVAGNGKNRRATWRAYQAWMANPKRGSRRDG